MKKLISIISVAFICVLMTSLVGCGNNSTDGSEKTFTFSDYGFEITLTNQFTQKTYVDYTVYLESDDVTFVGIKETYRDLKNTINDTKAQQVSTMDYANQSITKFNLGVTPTEDTENNWVFYSYVKSNKTYYAYVTKGGKGFWTCQFAFDSAKEEQLKSNVEKYAKSIKDLDEAIYEKDFENTELGFKITLLSDFEIDSTPGYDIAINSKDVMFNAKKYTFESILEDDPTFNTENTSPNVFAKYWIAKEGLTVKPKSDSKNGWSKFELTEEIGTQSWSYYYYALMTKDSFWLCRFYCKTEDATTLSSEFDGYAKTIVLG